MAGMETQECARHYGMCVRSTFPKVLHTCDILFIIFNKFSKISNKLLSRCHYGVLFVEF